jgi:hypothetical protein
MTRSRLLAALAAAYFVVAALDVVGAGLRASADAVGDGRVWLLLTSALDAQGAWPLAQVAVSAALAVAVAVREGIRTWWAAALAGHVGSAVVVYLAIAAAGAVGVASAREVAGRPDYGVSCVLAAGVGALLASGLVSLGRGDARRRAADLAAVAVGAAGAVVLAVLSVGWYASEHVVAVALGAGVTWALVR